MEWSTFWTAFGALSTAATAGGIVYAAQQIRFQAWLKAQEIFTEREFTKARTTILRRDPRAPWGPDEEDSVWLVCRRMDELARLAPYLPQHEILDAWDDSYAKLWVRLSPMVREERDRTHWNRKWAAFETLGLEAAKKLLREGRTEGTVS